jgi:multidrug efflux system outer membrane protein
MVHFPRSRLIALACALLLSGCAGFSKKAATPASVALPTQWSQPSLGDTSAAQLAWRDFVRDPALQILIRQALENNRDLRIATLNIEQARAQVQLRRADQLPTVNVGITGSRVTTGQSTPISSNYTGGLSLPVMPVWELDFFGRLGSLKDAAQAQFLASEQSRHAVQISLIAAVAQAWLNWQTTDAQLRLTQRTLALREDGLRLTRLRYDNGAASALDLESATSLTASTRAVLAEQQRQRQLDLNALSLLVGAAPATPLTLPERDDSERLLTFDALSDVPLGLPSTVLLQRPDVQAAEYQLRSMNAQIDAARAAFLPRISLTSSVGSASTSLSGLFKSGTWGWAIAPQAVLPIFTGGRNEAGLDSAQVNRDIAIAQYDKAIQTAFREVNDALAGRQTLGDQLTAQQALVQSETQRLKLAELRLAQGVSSQLDWLDAQRSLYAAQQSELLVRAALAQNRVALYKALGGGGLSTP